MFTTWVMACSIYVGSCVLLEDSYGPYNTREECKARATEIVDDVDVIFSGGHTYTFKCEYDRGI
tara:strand:- start:527 stop:718 length:192 start_codon:yes stop_codon:yes gene_type:complete